MHIRQSDRMKKYGQVLHKQKPVQQRRKVREIKPSETGRNLNIRLDTHQRLEMRGLSMNMHLQFLTLLTNKP